MAAIWQTFHDRVDVEAVAPLELVAFTVRNELVRPAELEVRANRLPESAGDRSVLEARDLHAGGALLGVRLRCGRNPCAQIVADTASMHEKERISSFMHSRKAYWYRPETNALRENAPRWAHLRLHAVRFEILPVFLRERRVALMLH